MFAKKSTILGVLTFVAGAAVALAQTPVIIPGGARPDDALTRTFLEAQPVPRDIYEVRQHLEGRGGVLATHIVANRGYHNPREGSFSFFESYTGPMTDGTVGDGEFFLGFFSERQGDELAVQQTFQPGLMIELIAWDYTKKVFNFWELIGTDGGSEWHYRGDSLDIFADIARIHVGDASPRFGRRLRCSGCHTEGGPVLKELAPHNDWWTKERLLDLGPLKLVPGADPRDARHVAASLFARARDVSHLREVTEIGIDRLVQSLSRQQKGPGTLREKVRPLFTTLEMNLATDTTPLEERADSDRVEIPSGFFVDPRLVGATAPGAAPAPVAVPAGLYRSLLSDIGNTFAADETAGLTETHHAFLVPVRSVIDDRFVDALVQEGIADDELVADVLAVDLSAPIYSRARQGLIKLVPETLTAGQDLKAALIANLTKAANQPGAQELLLNIQQADRTLAAHRARAEKLLAACREKAANKETVLGWLKLAAQRRSEVAAAETSKNPRGQILEPGFRVIFPESTLQASPGALRLNPDTCECEEGR